MLSVNWFREQSLSVFSVQTLVLVVQYLFKFDSVMFQLLGQNANARENK